jgi:hypothetical protein
MLCWCFWWQTSPNACNGTFLSQVGSAFINERNLPALAGPNKLSSYCSFISPTSAYAVDDNGCLLSATNVNSANGTSLVGSSTVAAAGQQVILMQPPQQAAQMPVNSTSSLNSNTMNKQFLVVNSSVPQQSGATVSSTVGTSTTSYMNYLKCINWQLSFLCVVLAYLSNLKCCCCVFMFSSVMDFLRHLTRTWVA